MASDTLFVLNLRRLAHTWYVLVIFLGSLLPFNLGRTLTHQLLQNNHLGLAKKYIFDVSWLISAISSSHKNIFTVLPKFCLVSKMFSMLWNTFAHHFQALLQQQSHFYCTVFWSSQRFLNHIRLVEGGAEVLESKQYMYFSRPEQVCFMQGYHTSHQPQ